MDQQRFDFPLDDLKRRRRRQKGRPRPVPTARAPREPVSAPLLETPLLQHCGFCGHAQTVLHETVLCDQCGSIIMRTEPAD